MNRPIGPGLLGIRGDGQLLAARSMPPIHADDVTQAAEAAYAGRVRRGVMPAGVVEDLGTVRAVGHIRALRSVIHFPTITLPDSIQRAIRRLFD